MSGQIDIAADLVAAPTPLPDILTLRGLLAQIERETGRMDGWPALRAALDDSKPS